jgi:uracil-DNA glycosylase
MGDLESPSSQVAAASNDEKPSVTVAASSDHDEKPKPNPAPSTTSSTVNGKRQRTLFDMLGSKPSQGSETSQATNKKPKLTASASGSRNRPTTAAGSQSSGGSSGVGDGLQALNSIPFSSTEYTASLNEDQKRLLKLECETMGKSW